LVHLLVAQGTQVLHVWFFRAWLGHYNSIPSLLFVNNNRISKSHYGFSSFSTCTPCIYIFFGGWSGVGGKFSRAFPRFCSHRARLQKTRALSSFRQTLFRDSPAATEFVCQSLEIFAPPIRRSLCRRGACAARNPLARLGSSPQTLPSRGRWVAEEQEWRVVPWWSTIISCSPRTTFCQPATQQQQQQQQQPQQGTPANWRSWRANRFHTQSTSIHNHIHSK